jgi:flagellar protein FliO/FliZ
MWLAFARTFGMLFIVLALFLVAFYLFKKFSVQSGIKGTNPIQVLGVHHISPKEKLMLVNVLNENILIGVTPQTISSLATLGEKGVDTVPGIANASPGFSDLLKKTLKRGAASMPEKQQGPPASDEETR